MRFLVWSLVNRRGAIEVTVALGEIKTGRRNTVSTRPKIDEVGAKQTRSIEYRSSVIPEMEPLVSRVVFRPVAVSRRVQKGISRYRGFPHCQRSAHEAKLFCRRTVTVQIHPGTNREEPER
jgi:hypothetical protein